MKEYYINLYDSKNIKLHTWVFSEEDIQICETSKFCLKSDKKLSEYVATNFMIPKKSENVLYSIIGLLINENLFLGPFASLNKYKHNCFTYFVDDGILEFAEAATVDNESQATEMASSIFSVIFL